MRTVSLLLLIALAACGGGGGGSPTPVPPIVVTIPDISTYLAQARCPDGSPPLGCVGTVLQRASDPMTWRKRDYGIPGGYQSNDAVISDDGTYFIHGWQFAPFVPGFKATAGDGGETYVIEGGTVRVPATEDGGTQSVVPGAYRMQYFVGKACGGTGWIAFDNAAPTGSWRSTVATLSDQADPLSCPPLGTSYTRFRLETLTIPFTIFGVAQNLTLPCVIYEHYDSDTIAGAPRVEQQIWARGWGPIWFAVYDLTGSPFDLSYRIPATPWPQPPERMDLKLSDARLLTNIVASEAVFSQTATGWPPPGYAP